MSGSSRRRHSKWDHKDSEEMPESFQDRGPVRRHREPLSPGRSLRRHDSRSKEKGMAWDREGNKSRMSPGLEEWSHQQPSRSPRNGWGQLYRSRSRSRSRSPSHHLRREPALNDRSRSRSGISPQVCRDFAAGRCRRADHCQFLHPNDQSYDHRRPSKGSPPDDWEAGHQRIGGSRYSPLENKDYDSRTEKSMNVCKDFLKGKCIRGTSCRYLHHDTVADPFEKVPIDDVQRDRDRDRDRDSDRDRDNEHRNKDSFSHRSYDREPADVFVKVPVDDVYRDRDRDRDRDSDRRSRDTYRSHDREPHKRGETLCKFFASGNCRNGNRCRFVHEVQERFSPERRSQDDRRGADRKLEGDRLWDGPGWSDGTPVSNALPVQGWAEEKNVTVVVDQVNAVRSGDDSWSRDRRSMRDSWNAGHTNGEIQTRDEIPLQWKTENSVLGVGLSASRGVENIPGDTEISPVDIKQHDFSSLNSENPSSANMSFALVRQDAAGDTLNEKPYSMGFQDQKLYSEGFVEQISNHKEDKPSGYHGEGRHVIINNDGSCNLQSPTMNTASHQDFFQNDQSVNENTSRISSAGQGQTHQGFFQNEQSVNENTSRINLAGQSLTNQGFFQNDQSVNENTSRINSAGQGLTHQGFFQNDQSVHENTLRVSSVGQGQTHQGFFQNDQSVNEHSSSISSAGQGLTQFPFQPSEAGRVQPSPRPAIILNSTSSEGPHLVNTTSAGHASAIAGLGSVSSEQLVQLSHLSASLAQLLESRQQLPPVSSNVTPPVMSDLTDSVSSVPPVSSSTLQPTEMPKQQYDPKCVSIEPKMHTVGDHVLPSNVEQKSPKNEQNVEGGIMKQQEPVVAYKGGENAARAVEESIKAPENKPSEDMPAEDEADDGKKSKDSKAIRPFKFALAEFVKELLKPSWKDGQINKDAYKAIVKKVVDKIIETQGLQIPQTKEKIDQYLSCSKPKIEKLVQAYVGRHQKN